MVVKKVVNCAKAFLVGLIESIPYIAKSSLETKIEADWLKGLCQNIARLWVFGTHGSI